VGTESFYLQTFISKFTDPLSALGVGLDELDNISMYDPIGNKALQKWLLII
jgi:hypothetical protein